MERKPCWGPSEPQREGRTHREANFQDEVSPFFYHPDLAEPSLESSGKQKCGSQSSGPSKRLSLEMGENSLKTGTLCLTGLAEADQEWARLEKDSTSIFFFLLTVQD